MTCAENTVKPPKKRRRGRRAAAHSNTPIDKTIPVAKITRKVPAYNMLDEPSLQALENQADWILEEIGIDIRGDSEALELFRQAGASIQGTRVRFEPGLAKSLCASAPSVFQMHARDSKHNITIGGKNVVLTPSYGPPFVSDLDNGRRYATIEDFRNFVKLAYSSPWLHHSGGTVCEPVDIPVNKRHLDMVYSHLRYSTKPFMGSVTAPQRAQDSIDMAALVFGKEFMDQHCVIQGNINVNSPLVFDEIMTGALKIYAKANQGIVLSPFILGGAMGPVTQPALIAQAHAEAMVGIALSQLVRPGAPVVYGNFLTTLNLKTGAPTFGTPEAVLSTYAIGQLCRRLGLPLRCGGYLTASKVADGQAMQESIDSMNAGLMAGANFILHAAGWLEGGLTMGYEKFMMDLDNCGAIHTLLNGLTIDKNNLAKDAFRQAGPGENFFGVAHTLENFKTANYMSEMADTHSFEQWTENGSLTSEMRANQRFKQVLADYEPPHMDASVDQALLDFIEQKKQSVEDQWY